MLCMYFVQFFWYSKSTLVKNFFKSHLRKLQNIFYDFQTRVFTHKHHNPTSCSWLKAVFYLPSSNPICRPFQYSSFLHIWLLRRKYCMASYPLAFVYASGQISFMTVEILNENRKIRSSFHLLVLVSFWETSSAEDEFACHFAGYE